MNNICLLKKSVSFSQWINQSRNISSNDQHLHFCWYSTGLIIDHPYLYTVKKNGLRRWLSPWSLKPLGSPGFSFQNRQRMQRSENLLSSLFLDMFPSSRCFTSPSAAVLDLLPYLLAIMCPSLRPVSRPCCVFNLVGGEGAYRDKMFWCACDPAANICCACASWCMAVMRLFIGVSDNRGEYSEFTFSKDAENYWRENFPWAVAFCCADGFAITQTPLLQLVCGECSWLLVTHAAPLPSLLMIVLTLTRFVVRKLGCLKVQCRVLKEHVLHKILLTWELDALRLARLIHCYMWLSAAGFQNWACRFRYTNVK